MLESILQRDTRRTSRGLWALPTGRLMPSPATFSRNGRCSAKKKKCLGLWRKCRIVWREVERLPMLLPLCHWSKWRGSLCCFRSVIYQWILRLFSSVVNSRYLEWRVCSKIDPNMRGRWEKTWGLSLRSQDHPLSDAFPCVYLDAIPYFENFFKLFDNPSFPLKHEESIRKLLFFVLSKYLCKPRASYVCWGWVIISPISFSGPKNEKLNLS
jgi:hypothetical protein